MAIKWVFFDEYRSTTTYTSGSPIQLSTALLTALHPSDNNFWLTSTSGFVHCASGRSVAYTMDPLGANVVGQNEQTNLNRTGVECFVSAIGLNDLFYDDKTFALAGL